MLDLSSLVFERAAAKDARAFVELEKKVAIPRIYEARLAIDDATSEICRNSLYFIKLRDSVIGSVSARMQEDGSVYFGNLAVVPDYRRKGVARAAMAFLIGLHKHATRLELVTHPENFAAIRLYTSLGFEIEGLFANYFGDGEPRVLLSRTLTAAETERPLKDRAVRARPRCGSPRA